MAEKEIGDNAEERVFDLQFKNILAPQNIADFGGRVPTNIYGINKDPQNILGIRKNISGSGSRWVDKCTQLRINLWKSETSLCPVCTYVWS